jgi:hypothetical protein
MLTETNVPFFVVARRTLAIEAARVCRNPPQAMTVAMTKTRAHFTTVSSPRKCSYLSHVKLWPPLLSQVSEGSAILNCCQTEFSVVLA